MKSRLSWVARKQKFLGSDSSFCQQRPHGEEPLVLVLSVV